MPLKGSMRQPKLDALQAATTGGMVGMSFFFTLASNSCDSRIPRESVRFSICLESWSSCRLNSGIERSWGGMLDMAPPRPGGSVKRNSPGFKPARADSRSPRASGCRLLRSEEHTSELQSLTNLVCRLLLEKKKKQTETSNI